MTIRNSLIEDHSTMKRLQVDTGDGKGWCNLQREYAEPGPNGEAKADTILERAASNWAHNYPPFRNAKFRIVPERMI